MMMLLDQTQSHHAEGWLSSKGEEHEDFTSTTVPNQSSNETTMASGNHSEAYFLYFIGVLGMLLNVLVIIFIILRRTLRKMTSAFLAHGCALNFFKSLFCIIFARNLLSTSDPETCRMQAPAFVVIITASAFNLVAMVCTEAYTFGETNIGGTSRGSICCIIFGVLTVYIASVTLHLGPTLIGGQFDFHRDIGNCSFKLGSPSGYIAHMMWISIITLALMCTIHFLYKFYKEIQLNQPNRVSMLVRTSITIMDEPKQTASSIRELVAESLHRAKIFVMTTIMFAACWYPLFILILVDFHYAANPKVYQTFSFIAWSQGTLEPIIYILCDRKLNLLARFVYCDQYKRYNREQIAYLMSQHRQQPSRPNSSNMDSTMDQYPRDHSSMDHNPQTDHRNFLPIEHHSLDRHHPMDPNLPMDHVSMDSHVPVRHRGPMEPNLSMDPRIPADYPIDRTSSMDRRYPCVHCQHHQVEMDRESASPSSLRERDDKHLEVHC